MDAITDFQYQTLLRYLNSDMFYQNTTQKASDKEARRMLKNACKSNGFVVRDEGVVFCSYGGLFGLGSKIKDIAYFDTEYFCLRKSDTRLSIIKYTDIKEVLYNKGDNEAVVLLHSSSGAVVPKFAASMIKGIEIVKSITPSTVNLLGEYMISMQERYFGEYSTIHMNVLFRNYFPHHVLNSIALRCSLVELDLKHAIFKITVSDKDLNMYSTNEWIAGIEEFTSRVDVLQKIQKELSRCLCIEFPIDAIQFTSRYKKTGSNAISNGVNAVADVASSIISLSSQMCFTAEEQAMRTANEVEHKISSRNKSK